MTVQLCGIISLDFVKSIHLVVDTFFAKFFSRWKYIVQCIIDELLLTFPCGVLSVLWRTVRSFLASSKSPPKMVLLVCFSSSVSTLSIYNCREHFHFDWSFRIRVIFPLVIDLDMYVSFYLLFIARSSLSWMELICFNQNSCMPSWQGVFKFANFFLVLLCSSPGVY